MTDDPELKQKLGDETYEALKKFTGLANKSTGSSHSLDAGRWNAFIILMYKNGKSRDLVVGWFEKNGYSEDVASDLRIELDFGLALLAQYDR